MDIQELIELIASKGKEYYMFYFTLLDSNSSRFATVVNCEGEEVARYDYSNEPPRVILTDRRFMRKTDDAIAFLFDCDIHLWQLVSCDIQQEASNCGLITTWNITLRR